MGRLKELRKYVNKELNKIEDVDTRTSAIAHLYGVSLAATMIAKRRELDEELAAMAAMLHDLYAYKSGSYDDHAHKGAELARQILNELGLTNEEETDIICSAIYHHDDKLTVDSPMDELLKDADVIHHTMNDSSKPIKEKEQKRYDQIIEEFNFRPLPFAGLNPFNS
ncbi:MAG: HD domain-containing protein [Eubacterium sp.]|nr:HD domain-containing protein [Eubacterium sp.]